MPPILRPSHRLSCLMPLEFAGGRAGHRQTGRIPAIEFPSRAWDGCGVEEVYTGAYALEGELQR